MKGRINDGVVLQQGWRSGELRWRREIILAKQNMQISYVQKAQEEANGRQNFSFIMQV